MTKFSLKSPFKPTGDQPEAIAALIRNLKKKCTRTGFIGSNRQFCKHLQWPM